MSQMPWTRCKNASDLATISSSFDADYELCVKEKTVLHRISLPAYVGSMERILDFQREVLVFACTPSISLPFEETEILDHFGDAGGWLWERLYYGGAKTKLCKKLEQIAEYVKMNPVAGKQILDAFEHDIVFNSRLEDGEFRFRYQ